MSFAVDTNRLLRSIENGRVAHPIVQNGLFRLRDRGEILSIFPQNLVEFWAVATRPVSINGLGLSINEASRELRNLKSLFQLLPDVPQIFAEWEQLVIEFQVSGKQVYDARLVAAMRVHQLTHLLTFNKPDFERFHFITTISPTEIPARVDIP